MHMLIRGLVDADTPDEALETAKLDVFTRLVDWGPFDYFMTFDADGRGVAGSDRWGDYPAVTRADSDAGRALIENGWDATVDEYRYSFERIQEFLGGYEPSAFWENGDVHREYHREFNTVGEYTGLHTYLYDQYGQGIRDRSHLGQILSAADDRDSETPETADRDSDLYVIPADVHY